MIFEFHKAYSLSFISSKRKIIQANAENNSLPRTIDFFCGAGGLSLGFSQEGFQIDLANDYEDVCIETFKYNHPEVPDNRVILGDLREVVNHLENYINKDIDVAIGGPPCQGFSSANQQRIIDDPRNELYLSIFKTLKKINKKKQKLLLMSMLFLLRIKFNSI